jgi:hypothetical protein
LRETHAGGNAAAGTDGGEIISDMTSGPLLGLKMLPLQKTPGPWIQGQFKLAFFLRKAYWFQTTQENKHGLTIF